MFTTGVSKIAASMAIVDATFTTTSLWRMRVGEMLLVVGGDVDGQAVAGVTVGRNGFSIDHVRQRPANACVGVAIVARMQANQELRRLRPASAVDRAESARAARDRGADTARAASSISVIELARRIGADLREERLARRRSCRRGNRGPTAAVPATRTSSGA